MKKVLIFGATGATGFPLLTQLLEDDLDVVALVRDITKVPEAIRQHKRLTICQGDVVTLDQSSLNNLLSEPPMSPVV